MKYARIRRNPRLRPRLSYPARQNIFVSFLKLFARHLILSSAHNNSVGIALPPINNNALDHMENDEGSRMLDLGDNNSIDSARGKTYATEYQSPRLLQDA